MDTVKSWVGSIEGTGFGSYLLAGLIGALIGVGYLAAVNRAHRKFTVPINPETATETIASPQPMPNPAPAEPSASVKDLSLRDLFHQEFKTKNTVRFDDNGGQTFTPPVGKPVVIEGAIVLDNESQTYLIALYVPHSYYTVKIVKELADRYVITEKRLLNDKALMSLRWYGSDEPTKPVGMKEGAIFSRRIIIYHEDPLTLSQKADIERLYKRRNLYVQFRGNDYLLDQSVLNDLKGPQDQGEKNTH